MKTLADALLERGLVTAEQVKRAEHQKRMIVVRQAQQDYAKLAEQSRQKLVRDVDPSEADDRRKE